MINIDTAVFYFFSKTCHNAVLDVLMPCVTELGNSKILFLIAVIFLFIRKKRIRISGILLMAGLLFSYYTVHALKDLVERPRPFMVLEGVTALISVDGPSFPSGHATVAFFTALIMTKCFRRWYIFYSAAAAVAVSRIYLGVHYPLDVVAGAVLGTVIGYILVHVSKKTGMFEA
ncbi:MAG: phosphatase PAP2 family protein [Candidatus Omnitrophota bacterium]|nr:phosphatase PAP2 family protein [Candidatus Omnitrophota bacterium]